MRAYLAAFTLWAALAAPPCLAAAEAGDAEAATRIEIAIVAARESEGRHDPRYAADFARLAAAHPPGGDELGLDPVQFTGALALIAARSPESSPDAGRTTTGYPAAMFILVRLELAGAFEAELDLDPAQADLLASLLVRQSLELTDAATEADFMRTGTVVPAGDGPTMAAILHHVFETSRIRTLCSIPYVAGYSTDNPGLVYIDALVPATAELEGRRTPLHELLNAHERIEKTLLDAFRLSYPHAHQIALRSERLFADAIGTPWRPYDAYWAPLADRIEARGPVAVPRDLDLTPYLTFSDADDIDLVRRMRASMTEPARCGASN